MKDPIQDFINRVKKLTKANKEMRLTYEEANAIAVALADLLYNKPAPVVVESNPIIDGGTFPKKKA